MARIFTTPDAEAFALSFMHEICLAGGLIATSQRTGGMMSRATSRSDFKKAADEVCAELVDRAFKNIDKAIKELTWFRIPSSMNASKYRTAKEETIAKAIVYFAERNQLYWDDTAYTPFEIDEFKKTYLGAAVYKYNRYISAIKDKAAKTTTSGSSSGSSSNPSAPKGAPKNGYKQSGPQSGNVRDLVDLNGNPGTPGQKVLASGDVIYKIIGDNPSIKNTPTVYINPISPSGASGTTNKVKIGSGNGYTDCTCYFDGPNEAQAFLDKIIKNNIVPANVSNMRVVKMKADPNGYFLVGTEFGRVAVSAKTLNEALTEAAKEVKEDFGGWEKVAKKYSKEELDELHSWMRKD